MSPYLMLPLVRASARRAIPLLRQELREVFLIEDRHELRYLAIEREGQPEDRLKVRDARTPRSRSRGSAARRGVSPNPPESFRYFNIGDEMLAEIVDGWSMPELPAIAPERFRAVN